MAGTVYSCLLKSKNALILEKAYNKDINTYQAALKVGRLENLREQGYIFTLEINYDKAKNFWVYEHRNVDSICIKAFDGHFLNTPTINDVKMEDKWDYDESFSYGKIMEAATYIEDKMIEFIDSEFNK